MTTPNFIIMNRNSVFSAISVVCLLLAAGCKSVSSGYAPHISSDSAWHSVETVFSAARTDGMCHSFEDYVLNARTFHKLEGCFSRRQAKNVKNYLSIESKYNRKWYNVNGKNVGDYKVVSGWDLSGLKINDPNLAISRGVDILTRRSAKLMSAYLIERMPESSNGMVFRVRSAQGSEQLTRSKNEAKLQLVFERGKLRWTPKSGHQAGELSYGFRVRQIGSGLSLNYQGLFCPAIGCS